MNRFSKEATSLKWGGGALDRKRGMEKKKKVLKNTQDEEGAPSGVRGRGMLKYF